MKSRLFILLPMLLALFAVPALAAEVAQKPEKAPVAVPEVIEKSDPVTEKQVQAAQQSASTKEYKKVSGDMHSKMIISYTGDADVDFVKSMIPHHQGAIDMAKVAMKYGKDEQIRKLAGDIIRAQTKEIAEMEAWLKNRKEKESKSQ